MFKRDTAELTHFEQPMVSYDEDENDKAKMVTDLPAHIEDNVLQKCE